MKCCLCKVGETFPEGLNDRTVPEQVRNGFNFLLTAKRAGFPYQRNEMTHNTVGFEASPLELRISPTVEGSLSLYQREGAFPIDSSKFVVYYSSNQLVVFT